MLNDSFDNDFDDFLRRSRTYPHQFNNGSLPDILGSQNVFGLIGRDAPIQEDRANINDNHQITNPISSRLPWLGIEQLITRLRHNVTNEQATNKRFIIETIREDSSCVTAIINDIELVRAIIFAANGGDYLREILTSSRTTEAKKKYDMRSIL
jgi:hypothetical protein